MCRKPCKSCPWTHGNKHNDSWPDYVAKMTSIGQVKNHVHKCHMITKDTWAYDSPITDADVCVGSLNFADKKS